MKRAHLHLREVHLHCDLTGFNFRSNQRIVRGVNDPEVTDRVLEAIEGKRLTYRRAHTAMHAKAKRPLRRFSKESQELPMGEFKAIQFCLLTGEVPGPVSLTLADAADPEKATKYLEIHLSIEKPKNLDALGLQLETLHAARDLIDAEIKRLLSLYEASRL